MKELFARIPHNRFFIEIGVEDGSQCNSALLAQHYGWRGIMIEADPEMFATLSSSYADLPVTCINAFVDRDNIVPLLEAASAPLSPDLMSIDIDGNDYYVWEATVNYRPSVVVVEYNASFGPTESRTIEYNPSHAWRHDRYYGASLAALEKLARRLGYALIGTDRRGVNGFFIRRDLLEMCGFPERTPAEAWRPNALISLLPNGSGPLVEP